MPIGRFNAEAFQIRCPQIMRIYLEFIFSSFSCPIMKRIWVQNRKKPICNDPIDGLAIGNRQP
jgi:hypothetical protein